MSATPRTRRSPATMPLLVAGAVAALAGAGPARGATVHADMSALHDADVVVNGSGMLDPTQDAIDLGAIPSGNFAFTTQSVSETNAAAGETPNGLPDDGFIAAGPFHPDVQLWWAEDDDGLNAVRLAGTTGTIAVDLPADRYEEVHVFATGGDGDAVLSIALEYADGAGAAVPATIPDWFDDPADTTDRYRLVDGRDRMQPGSGPGTMFDYEDSNDTAIFGVRLPADPARTLLRVLVDRTDSTGVLNLFGVTAVTAEATEACCLGDGSCADLRAADCDLRGGAAQGVGTDCGTTACTSALPGWTPDGATRPGMPLRVRITARAPLELALEWGEGCSPEALDWTVHEGAIGTFPSHGAVACDTGGARTSASVVPAAGGRYFLAVPVTADDEGSYGLDSFGVERLPSLGATCRDAQRLGCP